MPVITIIFFFLLTTVAAAGDDGYAVAVEPAPVLSTPRIRETLTAPLTDSCGQIRSLEFIALPGTVLRIVGTAGTREDQVWKVTTEEYPYNVRRGLFVHPKFLRRETERPPERRKLLPAKADILRRLEEAVGLPYLWGSNLPAVVPSAAKALGGQSGAVDGIDCSGLLYRATDGFTPRNTAGLISYGIGVDIAGMTAERIAEKLRPLDLVVWRGHVMIVLEGGRLIESRLVCDKPGHGGVHVMPLTEALRRIMKQRRPANTGERTGTFVVRRWFDGG